MFARVLLCLGALLLALPAASAKPVVSDVRLGIHPDFYQKNDIHIHLPEGATPKDGPSAGVAMFLAIVSLLTDVPVRSEVAMTGEISLRGLVLPIGGVKEKTLAALRAGIKTVMLPKRNEKDLEDVPAEAKGKLEFVFLERVEDAIRTAIGELPKRGKRAA